MGAAVPAKKRLVFSVVLLGLWALGAHATLRGSLLEELALTALAVPLLVLALGEPRPRWQEHALALATPLGLLLVFHLRTLDSWWIHDDPCLLASAFRGGIAPHFYDPQVWRGLSGSVLMPWTILSLGVDAELFGLRPAAFYAHQLVAFGVLVTVAYVLLRRSARFSAWSASLALGLFVASVPSFAVARQLMNRHYLEGLILFLAALALYSRSVDTGRRGLAVAGAGLYLAATTAKEVFVPLVAVLPFVALGSWRSRLLSALPFAVAALLYAPWRLYMLGWANSFSGYVARSDAPRPFDFRKAASMLGLERPWELVAAALILAGAVALAVRRWPRLGPALLVFALVVGLPLAPVLGELGPRHFLLAALGAGVLVAGVLGPWLAPRRRTLAAVGLALVLLALHTVANAPIRRGYGREVERHRTEGSFVLEATATGVLLTELADPSYLKCLVELRRDALHAPPGPGFCGDVCWCGEAFAGAAFWHAEDGGIAAVDAPGDTACAEDRELSVEMTYDRGAGRLAWRLGPQREDGGAYQILLVSGGDPGNVSMPVPVASAGEAPWNLGEPFRWIVKYRSSAGWRTYSPILTLDPEVGFLRWERQ